MKKLISEKRFAQILTEDKEFSDMMKKRHNMIAKQSASMSMNSQGKFTFVSSSDEFIEYIMVLTENIENRVNELEKEFNIYKEALVDKKPICYLGSKSLIEVGDKYLLIFTTGEDNDIHEVIATCMNEDEARLLNGGELENFGIPSELMLTTFKIVEP